MTSENGDLCVRRILAGGAAPYNPRTAVCAYSPGMSQGDEII